MKRIILSFSAIIIIAIFAISYMLKTYSLSDEKRLSQQRHTKLEDVLIKDAKLIYKTSKESSKRKILVLKSKDNISEVKSYYTILASEKGWNLVSEIPIKDGLILIFSGEKESLDISITEIEEGTKIVVSVSQE